MCIDMGEDQNDRKLTRNNIAKQCKHKARSTPTRLSARHPARRPTRFFLTMLFELWASIGDAGPQFKQHFHKRRVGRRTGNRVERHRA